MRVDVLRKISSVFCKTNLILIFASLFAPTLFGQSIATYPLASGSGNPTSGTANNINANVTAGAMISGSSLQNVSYNSSGFRVKSNSLVWPTSPTDGFSFDFPISPKTGFDIAFSSISFEYNSLSYDDNSTILYVQPYIKIDNAGDWLKLADAKGLSATPATGAITFPSIFEPFYSGHTYVVRFFVYAAGVNDKNDNFRIKNLVFSGTTTSPPKTSPIVTSVSTVKSPTAPKYSGIVKGTYSFGSAFQDVKEAGVVWSTSISPSISLTTKVSNGVSGNINSTISGLSANTKYYTRTYIITQSGVQYGAELNFTTDPPTVATVTTNPVTNILSNKAICGGVIPDSGGVAITEKGLVWGTTPNPTTTVNLGKLPLGTTASSFSDLIKGLTPLTKYYVRAYAINSLGTSYGNEQNFTTTGPVPVLAANPGSIDFGENYYNTSPFTVSYTLTGTNLSPASGSITITAPAGFLISKSGNTGFATTLNIPYSGGKINGLPIYAQLPVTSYGTFSGNITHSGGGAATVDADVVKLYGSIIQSDAELSNKGSDFWLGFGYQENMSKKSGADGEAKMSVYVTTGSQSATVHIDLTSGGYSQAFTIPPYSTKEFNNFPTGDSGSNTNAGALPDARLYSTGVSNKSIHVYTDNGVPVSVFLHTYTNSNTTAGAMIFPSNTWNSSYTVQSYAGTSNGNNSNSYFFVIANEDNTEITFTPSQPILDASNSSLFNNDVTTSSFTAFPAGQVAKVILQKGQVFNAMGGFTLGGVSLDLSGTTIKTTCSKKIAVFGGNGRVWVNSTGCSPNTGSDHLIQQMFPSVAWGTKYLTVPTKSMEFNYFRIYIQDITTIVKVDGNVLPSSSLVNNLYYQYQSKDPLSIISDKPINVSQFILSPTCTIAQGNKGNGDPEMIILSPVQQAITEATVYSPSFKGTSATPPVKTALPNGTIGNTASFINVVIPKEGVAGFLLDGLNQVNLGRTSPTLCNQTSNSNRDCIEYSAATQLTPVSQAFTPHPKDPNFYIATFWVETAKTHTLTSNVGFNAIAYGLGDGESYGYNAGTAIKNLSSVKFAVNPSGLDSSSTSVKTGKNNPVTLKIALPYNPFLVDKISWAPSTDPRITPSGSQNGVIDSGTGKAKYDGTIDVDGRTFYVYSSPVQYQFSEEGIYKVTATAIGTFVTECGGEDVQKISVIVGRDNINIDFNTTCGNPAINFVNNTTAMPGTTIIGWAWDFGDNTTSTLKDPPPHTYNTANGYKYTVKLTTTNSVGVITTGNLEVDFSGGLDTKFAASAKDVCAGTKITFDPSPTTITGTTSGIPVSWTWDFGEGTPVVINSATTPPAQDHTYLTAGKFAVKLTLKTTNNCENTFIDTVLVGSAPKPLIEAPLISCFGDEIEYLDKSTIDFGKIKTWTWTFDDNTTSADQNPKHKWLTSGPHKTTLTVTSEAGCPAINAVEYTVNVLPLPTAAFTVSAPLCVGTKVVFTDASSPNTTSSTISEWVWDFGDGSAKVTKTVSEPTEHTFTTAGPFDVTLTVKNAAGCLGAVLKKTITINAIPEPSFTVTAVCVPIGSAQFTASNAGTATINSWLWDFGDAGTSNVKNPLHIYAAGGKYTVKLTATSATGCPVAITNDVEAFDAPTPDFSVENKANLCSDAEVKITDLSKVNGYGSISKIELYWDYLNQPAVKSTFDFPTINTVYQNLYPNPTTAASKTYRVLIRAYTNPTCFKETYQDITVNAMPEAVLNPFAAVCQEKPSFDLTGGRDTRNLAGTGVYSGDGITTSPVFSPALAGPGTHLIRYTYTTTAGCTSIAEQEIVVNETPVVDLGNKTIYVKDKESKVLNPTIIKGANLKYTWSPSTYLSSATIENPSCRPLDDITYTLTVETPEGCKSTATVVVNLLRELLPPNTFTPNGDNYNDVWEIKYFDTYPNASVSVFNRYGKKVFEAKSGSAAWDGKFNGTDLPVGTYYYIVDPKDGSKTITGSVTIIR